MPRNITVTFADGSQHIYANAPDNLTPEQVTARAAQDFGKEVTALDGGKGPTAAAAPKDNSAARGTALGALKPFDNMASYALQIPGVKAADEWVAHKLGMNTGPEAVAVDDAARANNTRTGYQTLGNIAGTTLATIATRGKGGAFAQGALGGALLTDKKDLPGILTDAVVGGVSGKGLSMVGNGLSYLAKPVVSKAARALADAGIPLTLGQIAAGGKSWIAKGVSNLEQGAQSIWGLGDMIGSARYRGTEGFNFALANRILGNVKEKVAPGTEVGHDLVESVGKKLSEKYETLVPKLHGNIDGDFLQDISAARQSIKTLPNARQKQFMEILKDVFGNRAVVGSSGAPGTSLAITGATGKAGANQTATISGQALKDAESRLTMLKADYLKSPDADQKGLGKAIDKARDALRAMIVRNNPAHAEELQALNKAWAQQQAFRAASRAPGNATGVVTPAAMLSQTRTLPFRDKLVDSAKQLLPNTLPDSGTARRGALTIMALAGGGGTGAATLNPALAAPAAGSLLYTKAGQQLMNKLLLAPRGPAAARTAIALKALAKTAPAIAPAVVPPLLAAKQGQ